MDSVKQRLRRLEPRAQAKASLDLEPLIADVDGRGLNRQSGRLHGALAHKLGVEILKGVFPPNAILPNEIESSTNLKISRSAYREAMRILAAKGLVESRPKTGTRVTEASQWNLLDPDVLQWMFEAEPTEDFITGLFELRLITEPAAAALAAERRSDAQIATMEQALMTMEQKTLKTAEGRQADFIFHDTLMKATGNALVSSLSSSICAAVAWTTRYKQRLMRLERDPVPEHRAVFEAIKRKDPAEARWTMETLIRLALRDTQVSGQD